MERTDFIVIGGGIAGVSAAAELARHGRVVLVEREHQFAYHTTGRSAAAYVPCYGEAGARSLIVASGAFFKDPPEGFADDPLLVPLGGLAVYRADQAELAEAFRAQMAPTTPDLRRLSTEEAVARVAILRPEYAAHTWYTDLVEGIDVHGLLMGYMRLLRARGGRAVNDADVTGLARDGEGWRVATKQGAWTAPVVVNAAGAWADAVAGLAGVAPLGLTPMRRTAILVDPPDGVAVDDWPMVFGEEPSFYFRPDAGRLMVSPEDETPSEPCDARPEELDVAVTVDRLQNATTVEVRRPGHTWAGLRTFAPDRTLVAGFDPDADGFFWLAGQGGYGIETSPAVSRIAGALAAGKPFPADVADHGVTEADLSPARFR